MRTSEANTLEHRRESMREPARNLVVIDAEELDRRIEEAVRRALADRAPAEPAEWLDAKSTAAELGVSPRQIAKLAKAGALPHAKVGKLLRFRRADVEAYLAKR